MMTSYTSEGDQGRVAGSHWGHYSVIINIINPFTRVLWSGMHLESLPGRSGATCCLPDYQYYFVITSDAILLNSQVSPPGN